MKALTIAPFFAQEIVTGEKIIEVRTWKTNYRGPIVICSSAHKEKGTIPGHALGVVDLVDVVPFKKDMCTDALIRPSAWQKGLYAWMLDNNRLIVPQPVKGRLSLWNYDGPIEYIPFEEWVLPEGREDTGDTPDWMKKYWLPIMV